jgi:hypothetical protein
VSEKDDRMRIVIILNVFIFVTLTPDTRHLKPVWLKEKIDMLNPYYINYFYDTTLDGKTEYKLWQVNASNLRHNNDSI